MRALGLFSGGLDSILAAKIVSGLGVEVIAITFVSPFFDPEKARNAASLYDFKLVEVDLTEDFLEMLPNPRYGYGKQMNPCIDCKALMFRCAGQMMGKMGADFLFSGEVLGQRPMSQNKQSLRSVANHSGFPDSILRPLSAKLLPPIPLQVEGRINTDDLCALSGRGRQPQMELATDLGVREFPTPAGGCLLTDPNYSRRLKRLYETVENPTLRRFDLLKVGRHVRLSEKTTLVAGRDEEENETIEELATSDDALLRVIGFEGPTGLVPDPVEDDDLRLAASVVARYSDAPQWQPARICLEKGGCCQQLEILPLPCEQASELLI